MFWLRSVVAVSILLSVASAIELSAFYPFGSDEGDQLLPPNDDGSTHLIILNVSFPFFGTDHGTMFVNNNGVISFTIPVSAFTPEPFPLGNGLQLIAPFWGDVDTRGTGQVWYRETTRPDLLDRAQQLIRRFFPDQQGFEAISIFVATWDRVGYFRSHTDKTNTFQCVMVTDGANSFVIFLYADGGIQWTTGDASDGVGGFGGTPAHVGFNAGDGNRSATLPASRTAAIVDIELTSNVGVPGMWVLQVDDIELAVDKCIICNLKLTPHYGNQLGGAPIIVSGDDIMFREDDDITCDFGDQKLDGVYVNEQQALCVSPELSETGIVLFQLMVVRDGRITLRGEANYNSLPFQRAFEGVVESDEPVFESGARITVFWSPLSIFPLVDEDSYTVDITVRVLDIGTGEWKTLATLASDLPNSGEAGVTIPDIPELEAFENSLNPVVIEVGVSATSMVADTRKRGLLSDVLQKIGRLGLRIIKQMPMRIIQKIIRQAAQRLACEAWAEFVEDENIGQEINNRLPPCPCTADRAALDRGFREEKLSSIVKVVGQVQDFFGTTIIDDAFRNYFHPGAASCYRQIVDNPSLTGGSGQQCCYKTTGDIIVGPPGGGTVDLFSPDVNFMQHIFQDVVPFWLCCKAGDFSNCGRYYQHRPSDDCSRYVPPPPPARARGDPHLVTLDGHEYTFNGRGEFTLIETSDGSITLQGRMVDITSQNGGDPMATVFSAIAARERDSDVVQFQASDTGTIVALVNGEQVDFNVIEQQFKNVTVADLGNNTLSATFSSGAYLEVQQENGILSSLVASLPESYKTVATQGLLGTFNGDTSDDLKPPNNGTALPLNSTLRDIHYDFGLTWIIDTFSESLLSYPPGESWATYYFPTFQPVFQPVFQDADLETEANRLCGDDVFCLFDIAATGNTDLGLSTLRTSQEIEKLEELSLPITCDPPCENGACVANDTCACSQGFTGDLCTRKILMECEENPCENGGTCTRHVNDYTCTCPPKYSGYLCEVPISPGDECDGDDVFNCGDGSCYPLSFVCDGYPDCSDGSDEEHCDIFELTTPSELSLYEGGKESFTFCLTVTEDVENFTLFRQFSIESFTVAGDSAKDGVDHMFSNQTITFAGNYSLGDSECAVVNVTTIDDNIVEGSEVIAVFITPGPIVVSIFIIDNDYLEVGFESESLSVSESAGGVEIAVRAFPGENGNIPDIGKPFGLRVTSKDGSAVAGRDYQRVLSTVYFRPGENPVSVLQISIIDDELKEGNEEFALELTSFDLPVVLVNSILKLVLNDNDDGCPDLKAPADGSVHYTSSDVGSQANYSCNEGYTLVGMSTRVCQNDGSWSGQSPLCQSEVCTVELDGQIEVTGNSATYSFSGVGTGISGYICKLDGVVLPDCLGPLTGLSPGLHRLRVVPVGCSVNQGATFRFDV